MELHFSEEADEQEYWRARLLQPAGLAAYSAQRARTESRETPSAAAEEADQAAEAGRGAYPVSCEEVPEEGLPAMKSEPKEETVVAGRGMTAVGSLGRVKVPKAGFKQ